ncbi:hypothetical protein [Planococcus sp. YIM B11945]|uniref:hypothetical protein n=1 Tax=Planococcus sp. YIM B11945 TaxID=3435410 RepID=UPI003D7D4141
MKKKQWVVSLAALAVLIGCLYGSMFLQYERSAAYSGFPIPKGAELMDKNSYGSNYTWDKASGDEGIPFSYRLVLKAYGWEEVPGDMTPIYQKGDKKIDLITSTDYLGIFEEE